MMGFSFMAKYWMMFVMGLGFNFVEDNVQPKDIKCHQPPAHEYSIGEC